MDNSNKHARQSNEVPDRISDLPDEILQHILSFLPTNEAAQKSLLSKRWVNLWLPTPYLNFCLNEFALVNKSCWLNFIDTKSYGVKFKEIVETALYHHKSLFLHTFLVRFSLGTMCSELVQTCLSYVIKYDCKVFSMEAFISSETLCACLFACKSLEEMCLRTSFSSGTPKVIPEVVNLPHIKKLHLKSSTIDRGSISRLLSGCPVLEELKLEGCYITCLCIFNHKFKYLHLNDCTLKLQDHKEYFHMKSCIRGDTVEATIRIKDFYVYFVWKIQNACQGDVNPSSFMHNFIHCFALDDPLHNLSGVTILKLHGRDIQMLNKLSKKLGEFHNLKELCLSGWCMTCKFTPVALFLQKSPNLQSLSLHNYGDHCRQNIMGIHQMVDNSMLVEFARCKKLKVIHIKSHRNHIKAHELEEDLLPARQVFGNFKVILSQLYGFAFCSY